MSFSTIHEKCTPALISPAQDEILDNGCIQGQDTTSWSFQWSSCEEAFSYNLYVKSSTAVYPAVDIETPNNSFIHEFKGYASVPSGWKWKVRAKIDEEWGEWSNEGTFDVEPLDTDCEVVFDVDYNRYNTVRIGDHVWTIENLKTTKYSNGDAIPTGWYSWYNNDINNKNKYGALYNFDAVVNDKNICPIGWHVPTDEEWTKLEIYLQNNGYNFDGTIDTDNERGTNNKIAKSMASRSDWNFNSNVGVPGNTDFPPYRNKSCFSGLPGGFLNYDGTFYSIGAFGAWWTSTPDDGLNSYHRHITFADTDMIRWSSANCFGFSVRCIKDN